MGCYTRPSRRQPARRGHEHFGVTTGQLAYAAEEPQCFSRRRAPNHYFALLKLSKSDRSFLTSLE